MGGIKVAIELICLTLMAIQSVSGQENFDANDVYNLQSLSRGESQSGQGFIPSAIDTPSSTGFEFSSGQDSVFSTPDLGEPLNSSMFSDFESFDRQQPGAEIGSNFFGLNDRFDQGLLIRSGNVAMKIGGYLKVDLIQDFNPIGNTDAFDVTTIEIGAAPRQNTRFHARQTRLN